ncbi:arylsulfatase [Mariniflexile gromovii]|uniref:Arylsulfatase n=1 Tax=Mariniflexile gromovii TaxID=362523 RepID=A0ABS4BU86_9FLAO|nr:arylsulfatase [Mariniflexile gromovii]MBP0904158.1 arylsulfatase [Mariniflexile gromovii]
MKHVLLILLSFSVMTVQSQKANQSPNIIYILADDLGYGDVKCFNPEGKIPTPHLDEMATNGIKFNDAHTSSAVCTPTRYGILTGRYNWRTSLKSGVVSGFSKSLIQPDRITVADILKQQGYTTAFVGKWHLGWDWEIIKEDAKLNRDNLSASPEVDFSVPIKNGPSTHGFDYSFGFCGSLDMAPYVYVENDMPTMVPNKTTVCVDEKGFWRKGPTSDDFNHANVLQDLTDKAVNYISKEARSKKPFFLYFPLPAPHTPILPTTEFLGKSNTNMYGDFVMQVDDVVRQIREALKKQGISENTLLVFTSDNGCSPKADFEELAKVKHNPSYTFRGTKADIFEGGHRVPFIVEYPKMGLKNVSSDKIICTTDFFATCAELSGYKIQDAEAEDSFSMLPLITGASDTEIREYTIHHSIDGSFAIRKGHWKLNVCPGSGGWSYPKLDDIKKENLKLPSMQLYNLKADIGETNNLVYVFPEKVAELKAALKKIILEGRSTPGKVQENEGMEGWKQIQAIIK